MNGSIQIPRREPAVLLFASGLALALLGLLYAVNLTYAQTPPPAAPANGPSDNYFPVIFNPAPSLKAAVTKHAIALPHAMAAGSPSFCTWTYCNISPRLYHEPMVDGRTMIGWTDSSGAGHASIIGAAGSLEATFNFAGRSVRGLAVHEDGKFAVLLWDANAKMMWLTRRNADGSEIWSTNIDDSLTSFDPTIGDSRLAFGSGLYAAYFAVYGDSGWVAGHNGDALTYVNTSGAIQPSIGWEWGCSHSMAGLISYHPALDKFAPICSSDCYASKGILVNDNQSLFACDGNCGGLVSAQLGQTALTPTGWKLIFNALNRPNRVGRGIGVATVGSTFGSSVIWLTDTNGETERDPVMARLGSGLSSGRYLVGWMTNNDSVYRLGVINDSGAFIAPLEEVSSAGIRWGNRDDSFRTRPDGRVSWVQAAAGSSTLTLYLFDGTAVPSEASQ